MPIPSRVVPLVAICFVVLTSSARAEFPRIRPLDATVAVLLASGVSESPTFRHLVDRLEHSDVVIHVESSPFVTNRSTTAGILRFVTRAGGFRYLRIRLMSRLARDAAIALLGHELQHALEVAEAPSVTDDRSFEGLYRRIGDRCRDAYVRSYDTRGARDVERRVAVELREFSRRVIARR